VQPLLRQASPLQLTLLVNCPQRREQKSWQMVCWQVLQL
jgi:hypothetical protein